jgi:hypothetical protein
MSDIVKNPIEDHYSDIMSYTLNQSFSCNIEEDFLSWHSEIDEQMRNTLIIWLMKLQG